MRPVFIRRPDPSRSRLGLIAAAGLTMVPLALLPAQATQAGADGPVSVDTAYTKANNKPITAGDAISRCGTNRRQQNEPTSAVDPTKPTVVTSGSNDYCTVELAGGTWAGFYRSSNGGQTWQDSLLPGYPTDNSSEGLASPLHQLGIGNAGDPVQAWDLHGRLFFMGNAFNRVAPQRGSVWVATYDKHATRYLRTVIIARGTPATNGVFNDKTAIEADRGVNSPYDGNVYTAFSVFQGGGNNEIQFARSTDHGQTFSHPTRISEGSKGNQGADIAVTSNGDVYVTWNGTVGSRATGRDAMLFAKSTDGGRSFSKPRVAAEFDGFDAADFAGDPDAAEKAHERAFETADGPESEVEPSSAGNSRDCGSGPFSCLSGFVFFRHHSSPHITADPKGDPNKLYLVYDASIPSTETASTSTYNTAPVAPNGTLQVAQGGIYLRTTTDGGASWSKARLLAPTARGHQFFPDINATAARSSRCGTTAATIPGTACRTRPVTPPRPTRRATTSQRSAWTPTVPRRPTVAPPGVWSSCRARARCRTTRCSETVGCPSMATTTTSPASMVSRTAPGPTPVRSSRATTRAMKAGRALTCSNVALQTRQASSEQTPVLPLAGSIRTSTERA